VKQVNILNGKELKQVRKDYKLSQMDLIEIMGMQRVSYPMIGRKENNKGEISNWKAWEKLDKWLVNKQKFT